MSNGKKYLLSFTTFFNSRKAYKLFVNTLKRVEHKDEVPFKFLPWNRFEAVILRDFKVGKKVKTGASITRTALAGMGDSEGLPPDKSPKVTLLSYMYKIHDYMQAQTLQEAGREKLADFDFYGRLSEVIKTVHSDFILGSYETITENTLKEVDVVFKAHRERFYMSPYMEKVFEMENQSFLPTVSVVSRIHFDYLENNVYTLLPSVGISEYDSSAQVLVVWDAEERDKVSTSMRIEPLAELQKQSSVEHILGESSGIEKFNVYRLMQILYGDRALEMIKSNFMTFLEFGEGAGRNNNKLIEGTVNKETGEEKSEFIDGNFLIRQAYRTDLDFDLGQNVISRDVDNPIMYEQFTNVSQDYVVVHEGGSFGNSTQEGSFIDQFVTEEAQSVQDSLIAFIDHKHSDMYTVHEGILSDNDQKRADTMKSVENFSDVSIEGTLNKKIESGIVETLVSVDGGRPIQEADVISNESSSSTGSQYLGDINSPVYAKEIVLISPFAFDPERQDRASRHDGLSYGVYDKTLTGGIENVVVDSEYQRTHLVPINQIGYSLEADISRLRSFDKGLIVLDAEKLFKVPANHYPRFELVVLSVFNKGKLVDIAEEGVIDTSDLSYRPDKEFETEMLRFVPSSVDDMVVEGTVETKDVGTIEQADVVGYLSNELDEGSIVNQDFYTYHVGKMPLFNSPDMYYDVENQELIEGTHIVEEFDAVIDKSVMTRELELILDSTPDNLRKADFVPTFECVFEVSSLKDFVISEVTLSSEVHQDNLASLHKRRYDIRIEDEERSHKKVNKTPMVFEDEETSDIEKRISKIVDIGDVTSSLTPQIHTIVYEDDSLAIERKNVYVIDVDEEDTARASVYKHVVEIVEEAVSDAKRIKNIEVVQEDTSSFVSKVTRVDIDQENVGSLANRTKIVSVDEDVTGRGGLPQEPPWGEPRKRNAWLIIGKQYPAWNGWNPKKTR